MSLRPADFKSKSSRRFFRSDSRDLTCLSTAARRCRAFLGEVEIKAMRIVERLEGLTQVQECGIAEIVCEQRVRAICT